MHILRNPSCPYRALVGVGGIGTGCFFRLQGDDTLGRNESRPGELLDVRDYCKLHIVTHYIARLLGAGLGENAFRVVPIGKIGNDSPGQFVLQKMREVGMDTQFVTVAPGKPTLFSVCFQYSDGSGGNITTSNSAAAELSSRDVGAAAELFAAEGSVIALSVPEAPLDVRHDLLTLAERHGAFRAASFVSAEIAEAKRLGMFELLDLVALNESEAAEFLGYPASGADSESFVRECLSLLNNRYPHLSLVVSAGKRGAYGFTRDKWGFCPAPAVQVASTAGAGDALLAGVLSAIVAGVPFVQAGGNGRLQEGAISSALEFGVVLASYTVTSPHTIHPDACLDTVAEFARQLGRSFSPEFLGCFLDTGLAFASSDARV